MKFIIFALVLFVSFFVGSFGFCQIVGTLKYLSNFKLSQALFTITLWIVILALIALAVSKWLGDYLTALYIGYGITFLLSFRTTPDN